MSENRVGEWGVGGGGDPGKVGGGGILTRGTF